MADQRKSGMLKHPVFYRQAFQLFHSFNSAQNFLQGYIVNKSVLLILKLELSCVYFLYNDFAIL